MKKLWLLLSFALFTSLHGQETQEPSPNPQVLQKDCSNNNELILICSIIVVANVLQILLDISKVKVHVENIVKGISTIKHEVFKKERKKQATT